MDAGLARTEPLGRIESYRDNWWCSFAEGSESASAPWRETANTFEEWKRAVSPDFLTAVEKAKAAEEWRKLSMLDAAPNYLCAEVVRWAKLKPDDPRLPEALHLAVRSTRYGCANMNTGAFSKRAFDLLHRKYPKSPWAVRTKYWFRD